MKRKTKEILWIGVYVILALVNGSLCIALVVRNDYLFAGMGCITALMCVAMALLHVKTLTGMMAAGPTKGEAY